MIMAASCQVEATLSNMAPRGRSAGLGYSTAA